MPLITHVIMSVAVTPNCLLHAVSPITDFHTGVCNFCSFVYCIIL